MPFLQKSIIKFDNKLQCQQLFISASYSSHIPQKLQAEIELIMNLVKPNNNKINVCVCTDGVMLKQRVEGGREGERFISNEQVDKTTLMRI